MRKKKQNPKWEDLIKETYIPKEKVNSGEERYKLRFISKKSRDLVKLREEK